MSALYDEHRRLVKETRDNIKLAQRAMPHDLWRSAIDGYLEPALERLAELESLGDEWKAEADRATDIIMAEGETL